MAIPSACCCGCTISADTFSSTLDAKWTVDSGTWAINSFTLEGTGAGLIYDATAHPDGVSQDMSLQFRYAFIAGGGATNTFRFLISFLDNSNYLYVEVSRPSSGCTEMQVGEVLAGVDTPIGDPFPMEQSVALGTAFRTIKICYFATGKLRVTQTYSDGVGIEVDANGIGDKIGIQVVSGTGQFDDEAYQRGYNASTYPTCPNCNSEDCIIYNNTGLSGSVDTCFWEVISGTWGANYIPTGASILRFLRPHPTGKTHMRATARATVAVGESAQVFVNWLDANNHHYAECEWDTASSLRLSLYTVSAGVATLLDERFLTSSPVFDVIMDISVCYDGTTLAATAGQVSTSRTLSASAAATEHAGGVWSGIGGNGGAQFQRFGMHKLISEAEPADPTCPDCPAACGCIAAHVYRGNYTVDFGLGGWTDVGCGYCDQVMGEFILGEFTIDSIGVTCQAVYSLGTACVYSTCFAGADSNQALEIALTLPSAGGGQLKWRLTVSLFTSPTTDPGCCHPGAEAVYESDPFNTDECDVVPVTLTNVTDN
jgi:hypothetical protein